MFGCLFLFFLLFDIRYFRHSLRLIRWGIFRLSLLKLEIEADSFDQHDFSFSDNQVRIQPGCIDIMKQYALDNTTLEIIGILENIINSQSEVNTPTIRNPPFAAAIQHVVNFQLPPKGSLITKTLETYYSHQFWAPLLTTVFAETQSRCDWEVQCRNGHESGKGRMLADFGAYMVINEEPYYTLLAELERTATDMHKDFLVLAVEMRLMLEKNARQVALEDVSDLRMYGLLLTKTSACALVMRAFYDEVLDEISFSLKEDVATFDFTLTRSPQELIKDLIGLFSFIKMAADPNTTGISQERLGKDGQQIKCMFIVVIFF